VLATGGVTSAGTDPTMADYTEEEIPCRGRDARDKHRDVAVHAHGNRGIKRRRRAGVALDRALSMLDSRPSR
jgi:imidazolonepropionase-like amidohydrolase